MCIVDLDASRIPVYGPTLQAPFLDYLQRQKAKLHNWTPSGRQTWLQSVIFCIVLTCIISFVVSIIHAFAKNYQRRLREWQETADREMQNL
ncbi:unnamed protein product [Dicrocoelium dendriticum]|nr:unnamed protein product [Dicrocoelium dendriticum]